MKRRGEQKAALNSCNGFVGLKVLAPLQNQSSVCAFM